MNFRIRPVQKSPRCLNARLLWSLPVQLLRWFLGTAACLTGMDRKKIEQLPTLPGPQREVIIQKSHRYVFDQAVRSTGIKFVEVEGPDEMEKAINAEYRDGSVL